MNRVKKVERKQYVKERDNQIVMSETLKGMYGVTQSYVAYLRHALEPEYNPLVPRFTLTLSAQQQLC